MALLRRGSSKITEVNLNNRLQREKAKSGAVSASLAWNDPSDLDLHATVIPDAGGHFEISYRCKQAGGGYLDVDNRGATADKPEPVENIFWKKPLAGVYSIRVNLYSKRGDRDAVPFRASLKRDGEEDLSREGEVRSVVGKQSVECFRFVVDEEGEFHMGRVGTPLPTPKPRAAGAGPPPAGGVGVAMAMRSMTAMRGLAPMKAMKPMKVMKVRKVMKVMKVMKKPMKAMKVIKVMKTMKRVSIIARGKRAKVQVWQGKKMKTTKGLTKDKLVKSKGNKIVSAKRSEQGKRNKWALATAKARASKGYTGFKAIKKGTSFYTKAKEIAAAM